MDAITTNNGRLWLDEHLQEWEEESGSADFVMYQQLFSQFRLPARQWNYQDKVCEEILVEVPQGALFLDTVMLKGLELKQFLNPYQLYDYFLLEQWLGNTSWEGRIGLFSGKKLHFVFIEGAIDWEKRKEHSFQMNDLGRFILKNGKKKQLVEVQDTFFARMQLNVEEKMFSAYTQFQSKTGIRVDKHDRIAQLFDADRMKQLRAFSHTEIKKL